MSRKNPSILKYINKKGWKYTVVEDQIQVMICPYCNDKRGKFYINNITGQFICFNGGCGKEGNLYTLKKDLGDIQPISAEFSPKVKIKPKKYHKIRKKLIVYHHALLNNKMTLEYIYDKWGYTLEAVKKFKLGVQKLQSGAWFVIPYYLNGKILNAKFRSLPPAEKTFKRIKGMESALFNLDSIDKSLNYVFVCEGESDTIALDMKGYKNVVGVSVGARGIKPEWKDFFDRFEKIYIIYDNDEPGQDGAKKMSHRLGITKCYNIVIPGSGGVVDFNDFSKSHTSDEIKTLLNTAKLFDVDDVVSFNSALSELESKLTLSNKIEDTYLKTPWKPVNDLLGSFVPGDLIVLSGNAKIGKSTLALNLLLNYGNLGIPVLYYCLEMRPERIVTKAISYFRFVEKNEITKDDVIVVKSKFGLKPFYIAHSYKFTPELVFETLRESVIRYGIEFLCFDHLHFLVRSTSNVSAEVGNVVRTFKLLAEELKIPILLIAQPRKLQGKNTRMNVNDLRDSSSIGQDADTVIIVHRDRLSESMEGGRLFSPNAEIIVDATRYEKGGMTELYFDGAVSRYFLDSKERAKRLKSRK